MSGMNKKTIAPSIMFVIMMGIVSMFSDMTHEGARSIYGSYLSLAGASAATIGFVVGLGEMLGYSLRFITGIIADKSKKYWTITIAGYCVNMFAVPLLALVPEKGWQYASVLIIAERVGKAIRQPSKNTLVSFAASQVGEGRSFALLEFMDQIGAFIGPMLLFLVLLIRRGTSDVFKTYSICFAILVIPAALTIVSLLIAKKKFPAPEQFEPDEKRISNKPIMPGSFILYIFGTSLLALGFIDFPLITMHIAKKGIISEVGLPLIYAGAMLVDAIAALIFGWLYDYKGLMVIVYSSFLSAFFSIFIFHYSSVLSVITGVILWGIGMGAQESILKSVIATITPKSSRSRGFGFFETFFGVFWFIGSWIMGYLYDISIMKLILFSVSCQLLSLPFLCSVSYLNRHKRENNIRLT